MKDEPRKKRVRGPRERKQKSEEFLSRLDIAKLLGVTPSTIIEFEKSGQLTPFKFSPRLVRYPVAEVQSLIDKARCRT